MENGLHDFTEKTFDFVDFFDENQFLILDRSLKLGFNVRSIAEICQNVDFVDFYDENRLSTSDRSLKLRFRHQIDRWRVEIVEFFLKLNENL